MLDAEFVNAVRDLAVTAAGQVVFPAAAEPSHVYLVKLPDGTLQRIEALPKPERVVAASLEALVAWTKGGAENPTGREIYYHRTGVVGGPAPADLRKDRIHFPLAPSPQLAQLEAWSKQTQAVTYSQRDLVRLFSTTFADAGLDRVTESVRKVDFRKGKEVVQEVQKGRMSMSRQDVATMTGSEAIPPELKFVVPVFSAASLSPRAEVRVYFEPDPETERFLLVVIPGEIEQAYGVGEDYLARTLQTLLTEAKADAIPVYHGVPA